MNLDELTDAIKADPEEGAKRAHAAIEAEKAVAAKEADEKAAILRNKEDILGQLKKRKDLGPEEDILRWKAAYEEAEAQRKAEDQGDERKDDDEPEALKLERRRFESERDLMNRRHQEELDKIAAKAAENEAAADALRSQIDRNEIMAEIRKAGKGLVLDDGLEYLTDKLQGVFRRESDGSWTLHNPKTDLPMRSSAGTGPKPIEELVEEAMESKGSDPWSKGLGFCFKPLGAGERTVVGKSGRITHDHAKMTKEDKLKFIEKHGPEKFGAAVNKSTNQLALEASKAAAERRGRQGLPS